MLGTGTAFGQPSSSFGTTGAPTLSPANKPTVQVQKDFEVTAPPDDSVSCLSFSPATVPSIYLIAGSWDSQVRCWEVDRGTGKTTPKSMQSMTGPILDVCWHNDGTKVFMASCDKTVQCWDLTTNQSIQAGQHGAPVKTCHWIKAPHYQALMTSSWDKTVKFWDVRSPPTPILTMDLPERSYCADVEYPMAVVGTASCHLIVYNLEGTPTEFKKIESPMKCQHRCISIFKDKEKNQPAGFGTGTVEGRVAIQYVNSSNPKDNFTFKCHRSTNATQTCQDIYVVNGIKFHPVHGTLATVGSDGRYSFWDKDVRTKLKTSEQMEQSISSCAFSSDGQIFAYSVSYDWSLGHVYYDVQKKNKIFLHPCYEDLKSKPKTTK